MAAVPYPSNLPTFLKASKSRKQAAVFDLAESRRGYAHPQETGTDVPVYWDVTFRFGRFQAQQFWLWFVLKLERGKKRFTIPIDTEGGLITHTCRFMPDALMPASEDGGVWTYTATIEARAYDPGANSNVPDALLFDSFTASDGTNPTSRDIDTHPAFSARWESAAIGPPLNVDGQIIGNRLTFDAAVDPLDDEGNVSLRYRSPTVGEPVVSAYPLFLLIRANIVDTGFGAKASLALTDGAATLLRCEISSTGTASAYASGASDFYSSSDFELGIGAHTVGLYVTQTSVALYAGGTELESFDTTFDFDTDLTRANLQLLAAEVSAGYGLEHVAIYQGITSAEAAALTA